MYRHNLTLYMTGSENCHFSAKSQRSMETTRLRLMVVMLGFLSCFLVICGQLCNLALFTLSEETRSMMLASNYKVDRADIVDRQGVILATSLHTASLYANPQDLLNYDEAAQKISQLFPQLSYKDLKAKLDPATGKSFVWLKRNLTPQEHAAVLRLGLPGLAFQREEKRIYPHGALTGHVVGMTDVDGNGVSGIEKSFDEELRTSPIQLSLDVKVQNIVREELYGAITEFEAKGGNCIVLDANTSEVVAMVSLPDFDPGKVNSGDDKALFNVNTLGIQEIGSVFKILTIAMGLDSGKIKLNNIFDATHPLKVASFSITDFKGQKRPLSVPEIFMHSSNIGTARIAAVVGTKTQQDFFRRAGLLTPSKIELPEIAMPMRPEVWREINTLTMSYGYGLGVSPLQFVNTVAAVVNGGQLHTPTILKINPKDEVESERLLSPETSDIMRRLMRVAVLEGTGKKANAVGYMVGGKSGTANTKEGGAYVTKNANRSSFVGAFPINNPKYIILTTLDKPQGSAKTYGYSTGGWTAAPTTRKIVERIAPLLGVQPVDEQEPSLIKATYIDLYSRKAVAPKTTLTPVSFTRAHD